MCGVFKYMKKSINEELRYLKLMFQIFKANE